MAGPQIRTDIMEVYVFRPAAPNPLPSPIQQPGQHAAAYATARPSRHCFHQAQFLQLRRIGWPMPGTWQPVMGHVEQGETAVQAALRELKEETGFAPAAGLRGLWQLEILNTFFMAAEDAVVLSPGFAALVDSGVEPQLDRAHDSARWIQRDQTDQAFLWPGQRAAIQQIVRDILPAAFGSPAMISESLSQPLPVASVLRIDLNSTK